ncbi:hypothetical protein [Bradyrhizobium neotropicale]|uniref:hypothetical protein n=1 Tax=Bradyrhizobium neotropicale TaxID=1497615 RepID=UPI001AD75594|nr:hypothetical protein [Bradyrhizobium neotropicale]MBO4222022.1 hypothetical protein [Bradyrhizobium neotropicale]
MIDHQGSIYAERVAALKLNLNYDLPLVRSLHGQRITLGFLVARSAPFSTLPSINRVFSTMLDRNFFDWLAAVRKRLDMQDANDTSARPIISDIEQTKQRLFRLFDARHILVHEFPTSPPMGWWEMEKMIDGAEEFLVAIEEGILQLLYGIDEQENVKSATIISMIESLNEEIAQQTKSEAIFEAHKLWRSFAEADAKWTRLGLEEIASERWAKLRGWLDTWFPPERQPPEYLT